MPEVETSHSIPLLNDTYVLDTVNEIHPRDAPMLPPSRIPNVLTPSKDRARNRPPTSPLSPRTRMQTYEEIISL